MPRRIAEEESEVEDTDLEWRRRRRKDEGRWTLDDGREGRRGTKRVKRKRGAEAHRCDTEARCKKKKKNAVQMNRRTNGEPWIVCTVLWSDGFPQHAK